MNAFVVTHICPIRKYFEWSIVFFRCHTEIWPENVCSHESNGISFHYSTAFRWPFEFTFSILDHSLNKNSENMLFNNALFLNHGNASSLGKKKWLKYLNIVSTNKHRIPSDGKQRHFEAEGEDVEKLESRMDYEYIWSWVSYTYYFFIGTSKAFAAIAVRWIRKDKEPE